MLRVISPGLFTSIQDLGRPGYRRYGVPLSGAMDRVACQIANHLVGNAPTEACLEVMPGAMFEAAAPCVIAITGADLGATLNGRPLPLWISVHLRSGARLAFESRRSGARAYLALAGGIEAPVVLGSRSTYVPARIGQPLQADDRVRPRRPADLARVAGRIWPTPPDYAPVIRLLPGPHAALFEMANLVARAWRVGTSSNRIGLRLEGAPVRVRAAHEIASLAVLPGAIQIPPDGQPIVLMADAQPTGGYPIAAVVIQADLHRAAQLLPGDEVRFISTSPEEAIAALHALRRLMTQPVEEDEGTQLAACMGSLRPAPIAQYDRPR